MTTKTKTIREYSFRQFIHLHGCNDTNLFGGCMVSPQTIQPGYTTPSSRVNAYIVLLCTEGEIQITLNMHTYRLRRYSLFIYSPNTTIQVKSDKSCSLTYIVLSPEFLRLNYHYWKQILPLTAHLRERPLFLLTAEETREYIHMAECVNNCMRRATHYEWYQEAVLSGIKMLLYTVFYKIENTTDSDTPIHKKKYQNRSEEYFTRFMELLSAHYKQERKVEFYASKLCITPKYFATVIKEASGRSPAKWIEEVVLKEAQHLLKHSYAPIKEIAYELNFTDLSFFGKYFKRYTGISPHSYRRNESGYFLVADKMIANV